MKDPHELVAKGKRSTCPGVASGSASPALPVVDLDVAIAWFDPPSTGVMGGLAWPRLAGATLGELDVV
jgi:hypothetical protein